MNSQIKSKIALISIVARNLDMLIRTNKLEESKEASSKLREMLDEIQDSCNYDYNQEACPSFLLTSESNG